MTSDRLDAGWKLVAENDGAALLLHAIVALDPDETYTKTELAESSGVTLKTLHLEGTLSALEGAGLLVRDDDQGGMVTFGIDPDSPMYAAAREFASAVERQGQATEAH